MKLILNIITRIGTFPSLIGESINVPIDQTLCRDRFARSTFQLDCHQSWPLIGPEWAILVLPGGDHQSASARAPAIGGNLPRLGRKYLQNALKMTLTVPETALRIDHFLRNGLEGKFDYEMVGQE